MKTEDISLARRSELTHPTGAKISTPLLVPSFSSKGFRIDKNHSEIKWAFGVTKDWLTETMLISAYDLKFDLISNPIEEEQITPELIIVDSGGYESRVEHDWSTTFHSQHVPKTWNNADYIQVLDKWPDRLAASFVSFDSPTHRIDVPTQVTEAKELFSKYPNQFSTFLLKPETKEQIYLKNAIEAVKQNPHLLAGFTFVGVTEKELGKSILDRMKAICTLRQILDGAGIKSPIHVFGALDPLACVLYFLAGAEVFDGLTWLRFAYKDGLCTYLHNNGAIVHGIESSEKEVLTRTWTDNIHYLRKLTNEMKVYLLKKDLSKFEHHVEFLKSAQDLLSAKLEGDK